MNLPRWTFHFQNWKQNKKNFQRHPTVRFNRISFESRGKNRVDRGWSSATHDRLAWLAAKRFYYLLRTRTRSIPVQQATIAYYEEVAWTSPLPPRDERDNLLTQSNLLLASVAGWSVGWIAQDRGHCIESRRKNQFGRIDERAVRFLTMLLQFSILTMLSLRRVDFCDFLFFFW